MKKADPFLKTTVFAPGYWRGSVQKAATVWRGIVELHLVIPHKG